MFVLVLRHTAALWGLQIVFGALAHLLYDWAVLALMITGVYLLLAGWVAVAYARASAPYPWRRRATGALVAAVLWQLPMLLGSVNLARELLDWTAYDANSDLLDFAMQTWATVLMPILTLLPRGLVSVYGFAWYYIGLALASPVLTLAFFIIGAWPRQAGVEELGRDEVAAAAMPDPATPVAPTGVQEWQPARRVADALHRRRTSGRRPR